MHPTPFSLNLPHLPRCNSSIPPHSHILPTNLIRLDPIRLIPSYPMCYLIQSQLSPAQPSPVQLTPPRCIPTRAAEPRIILRSTIRHDMTRHDTTRHDTASYHTTRHLTTPRHIAPHHTTPHHTTPGHARPHHTMPCHATPRHTILHHTTPPASHTVLPVPTTHPTSSRPTNRPTHRVPPGPVCLIAFHPDPPRPASSRPVPSLLIPSPRGIPSSPARFHPVTSHRCQSCPIPLCFIASHPPHPTPRSCSIPS